MASHQPKAGSQIPTPGDPRECRWPDAGGLKTHLDAEVAVPNVRAQIHSYFWPEGADRLIQNRKEYYLSRTITSDQSAVKVTAEGSAKLHTAGALALHPAKFPVRIQMPAGWHRLFICLFEPVFFEETTGVGNSWDAAEVGLYYDIKSPFLGSIMKRMQNELEQPGFAPQLLVESASSLLLVDVARYLDRTRRHGRGVPSTAGRLAQWQLRLIDERVQAFEDMGCPSLDELASLCGIGRHHLMRRFKASTGETVHRYVERARLGTAKRMLTGSSLSAKQIAFRLGFKSPAYFSVIFRRLTAMTPTQFRARARS